MRAFNILACVVLAGPVLAAPPETMSPMNLPAQGGYIQPGNPDRAITMVGRESALVRERLGPSVTCASRGNHRTSCRVRHGQVILERRLNGRCSKGRDWSQINDTVVVTNSCKGVFTSRRN